MSRFLSLVLASGMASLCLAESHRDRWPVREEETIQKTLPLSGSPQRVVVENIEGYVHVTTGTGPQVQITAHKSIHAESDADLQRAKSEVQLNISGHPGEVNVQYTAPWICRGDSNIHSDGCHSNERRFYDVVYDIDLVIPRNARPVISTVTDGDVRLEGTTGDFDIGNVNGGITLTGIAGSGDVHTVNGPISARFSKSPAAKTSFKTINGSVDTWFPPDLSADLRFKTMNGEIFTDFDVTASPIPDSAPERQGPRFVYRSNGLKGGRIGQGGPELSFNTLNGTIRLHRAATAGASNDSGNDK